MILLIVASCSHEADPAGNYIRSETGISETLDISRDGTFVQTVVGLDGKPLILRDHWSKNDAQIQFHRFYITRDVEHNSVLWPPEERSMVNLEQTGEILVKNADQGYIYRKK